VWGFFSFVSSVSITAVAIESFVPSLWFSLLLNQNLDRYY
jgi:hypothetical protein